MHEESEGPARDMSEAEALAERITAQEKRETEALASRRAEAERDVKSLRLAVAAAERRLGILDAAINASSRPSEGKSYR